MDGLLGEGDDHEYLLWIIPEHSRRLAPVRQQSGQNLKIAVMILPSGDDSLKMQHHSSDVTTSLVHLEFLLRCNEWKDSAA